MKFVRVAEEGAGDDHRSELANGSALRVRFGLIHDFFPPTLDFHIYLGYLFFLFYFFLYIFFKGSLTDGGLNTKGGLPKVPGFLKDFTPWTFNLTF